MATIFYGATKQGKIASMDNSDHTTPNRGYVVVSAGLHCHLQHQPFSQWRDKNEIALVSPLPLGFAVTAADLAAMSSQQIANIAAAHLPIETCVTNQDVTAIAVGWAFDALGVMAGQMGDMRAAMAALRRQHEDTQLAFSQTEDWLATMLAPRFVQVRQFPRASGQVRVVAGDWLRQKLPCSQRGLAAIDVFAGASNPGGMIARLLRWNGDILAEFIVPHLTPSLGWHRLALPCGLSGPDEDVTLEMSCTVGEMTLGLAQPVPFEHLRALTKQGRVATPLALTIWAGLPGVTLPPIGQAEQGMPAHQGQYLAAMDLDAPHALKGTVYRHKDQGGIELRPDDQGAALMVIRKVQLGENAEIEAFVQMFGDTGAIVTFAATHPGMIVNASDSYRLPSGRFMAAAQFCRTSDAIGQPVMDIVLRVENAHPGSALRLWALKLTTRSE